MERALPVLLPLPPSPGKSILLLVWTSLKELHPVARLPGCLPHIPELLETSQQIAAHMVGYFYLFFFWEEGGMDGQRKGGRRKIFQFFGWLLGYDQKILEKIGNVKVILLP